MKSLIKAYPASVELENHMDANARRLLKRLQDLGGRDGRGDMPDKDKALREEIDAYAAELATKQLSGLRDIQDPERRLVKAVVMIRDLSREITERTASRNVALAIACKPAHEGGDNMKKTRAARRVALTRGYVHREALGHNALGSSADVAKVRAEYAREFGPEIAPIEVAQIEEAHIRYMEAVRNGAVDIRIQTIRHLANLVHPGSDDKVYPPHRLAALTGMETSQVSYDLYTAGEGSRQRRYGGPDNLTTAQIKALRDVGADGRMSNRGPGRVHLNTMNALARNGLAELVEEKSVEVPVPGRRGETQQVTEYVMSLTDQGWETRAQLQAKAA